MHIVVPRPFSDELSRFGSKNISYKPYYKLRTLTNCARGCGPIPSKFGQHLPARPRSAQPALPMQCTFGGVPRPFSDELSRFGSKNISYKPYYKLRTLTNCARGCGPIPSKFGQHLPARPRSAQPALPMQCTFGGVPRPFSGGCCQMIRRAQSHHRHPQSG